VTLIPTLIAFRWPIVGGSLIIGVGLFALGFFDNDVAFIGLTVALVGSLFVWDGILKRRHPEDAPDPSKPWWRRHLRYVLLVGLPAIVAVGVSAYNLPIVLTRVDDGDRGARLIRGNEVALVWAPEGPGWNYKQPWGGYPSWEDIALYGLAPIGFDDKPGYGRQDDEAESYVFATGEDMAATNLCLYLSEDGLTLKNTVQGVWRMPTTDEIVRSLARHGENTGCEWQGERGVMVECDERPDKESPLWSTDHAPIYYWSADEHDEQHAYFVAFNGTVADTKKHGGNPRHSHRCVREP
jgi:hypothetical protein